MYENCFLCNKKASIIPRDAANQHIFHVNCNTCGKYITNMADKLILDSLDSSQKSILSGFTREVKEYDRDPATLTEDKINQYLNDPKIPKNLEKIDILLSYLNMKSKNRIGEKIKISASEDYPLAFAEDEREMGRILHRCLEMEYLKSKHPEVYTIETKGLERIKEIAQNVALTNNNVPKKASSDYVDKQRIEELKTIKSNAYDLGKLIQLCEELNITFDKGCYLSVAMLVRAILDHVPPIFQVNNFSEIANNYKGAVSFKKSMSHLQNSLRNIADSFLHVQIRNKETLPNPTQINFSNDVDRLLEEIYRILK